MAPRLSGQTSIFGVVVVVVFFNPSILWELRDKRNIKIYNFGLKAMQEY